MSTKDQNPHIHKLIEDISAEAYCNESSYIDSLIREISSFDYDQDSAAVLAKELIENARSTNKHSGIETFFHQYGLDTSEGLSILALTEALLRIPDTTTRNALIHDHLSNREWKLDTNYQDSTLAKTASASLQLASILLSHSNLTGKLMDPIIRQSIQTSIQMISGHFVIGETISKAIKTSKSFTEKGYLFSYDILGEGARSETQAHQYLNHYLDAVGTIGKNITDEYTDVHKRPSISVKLSALCPRYELLQEHAIAHSLLPKLFEIASACMERGINMIIDAEELSRLDCSLAIFSSLLADTKLRDYQGAGLAIQSYHFRTPKLIDFIDELANLYNKRVPVRLVKGAYWDYEIKQAQLLGTTLYPIFTQKAHTDISYLYCAYKMLQNSDYIFPQFATHNALTIASIIKAAGDKEFELQMLYGMGSGIYNQLVEQYPCRIYAPVGPYKELLPYLIRRILENASGSSFMKGLANHDIPVKTLIANPINSFNDKNPRTIPLPIDIYEKERKNSSGWNLGNMHHINILSKELNKFKSHHWEAHSVINGKLQKLEHRDIYSPYNLSKKIGIVSYAREEDIHSSISWACKGFKKWQHTTASKRAKTLQTLAELIEKHTFELIALCMHEAGKTLADSIDEVREAIDFCRYYATESVRIFSTSTMLTGPTGESNTLSLHPRGVFVCISPWNFPLAIFTGQIAAALGAGNTVIAKPAEQTSLIAKFIVKLAHESGIPDDALHLLLGEGEYIGKVLLSDHRIDGIAFTGSNETATRINQQLANQGGVIIPFIAETGGINAMIVDSSALLEQAVDDIIASAFTSAGQRCSSLRVLYIQEDILEDLTDLISGAMAELKVGPPTDFSTDIGPVIDRSAQLRLQQYTKETSNTHDLITVTHIDESVLNDGYFIAPHLFAIKELNDIPQEIFGPVLHIISFHRSKIDEVINQINNSGYGLTIGIHSRINSFAEYIATHVRVGNCYINRSMISAKVGTQPFGGFGLSGTGPKAGGPNYLARFAVEKTITTNTTAIGGNKDLLV